MVDGLIRLMDTPHEVTGPINIGNPNEFTMKELADRVIELVGGDVARRVPPAARRTIRRSVSPNITKAKEILGWRPTVELGEGLAATIDFFRKQLLAG